MRVATVLLDGQPRVGIIRGEFIDVHDNAELTMRDLIESGEWSGCTESVSSKKLEYRAPIGNPEKLICIGKNYADHAKEMGGEPPTIPVVFSKFSSAIIGPGEPIVLPEISSQVDFEAELVVVIGKGGKSILREAALGHVFGYTCGNDISARDWQKGRPGGQWLVGKTFDTFAPLGPSIVTTDELPDPHGLSIGLKLNGRLMQSSNTSQLLFPIDQLIAHISQFCTLAPGDLIFTGTPSGVGAGRTPPLYLKGGDELEVFIEKIGSLSNRVVASDDCK